MTCEKLDTDLCILAQVDPLGDVVDGGDPLEKEEGAKREGVRTQQPTQSRQLYRKTVLPPHSPSCSQPVASRL